MTTRPHAVSGASTRPLTVGLHILQTDGPPTVGWREALAIARRAEEAGFDAISMGEHFIFDLDEERSLGVWDCWSFLAGLAASTSRIRLETLVSSTAYRNPALLAKIADTVDEMSGGRFILGIGAGWHEQEFRAFGFPFDHRVSRFEEAIQIISALLRERYVDFEGHYYEARACKLLPAGPREQGPPIMVGGGGPRVLRLAARYADAWNADAGTTPETIVDLNARVDEACADVGRDPATLERSAFLTVDLSSPSLPGDTWLEDIWSGNQMSGTVEEIAAWLRAYATAGIQHVQLWLNPCSVAGVEAFVPVLEHLDAG